MALLWFIVFYLWKTMIDNNSASYHSRPPLYILLNISSNVYCTNFKNIAEFCECGDAAYV
ncbi:Protein of unknown function [Gryllus bimaculatus]|nr:Protein of unknown function [Gryllus bimaculatus]